MAYLYAISDPHGGTDVLERALNSLELSGSNHLYLLGDYVPHATVEMSDKELAQRTCEALRFVRDYQSAHSDNVSVLCGNHELFLVEGEDACQIDLPADLRRWIKTLQYYVETEWQIFVHAGVDEEAGEFWRWGSEDAYFCSKYPPSFGRFEKDIVAGHIGVGRISGDPNFEGIYWDGASHYYLDATTETTGRINILQFDTETRSYTQRIATKTTITPPIPIPPQSH